MECTKSFTLHSSSSVASAPANIWTQNSNNYWVLDYNLSSSFVIQGFKNVNIHSIQIIGALETDPTSSNKCIIQDWGTTLQLQEGTIPQISGNITAAPNQWALDNTTAFARLFTLGKYQNKVTFESPFQSVKTIQFLNLNASGIGSQTIIDVSLKWNFQWIFEYSYEGEQY